MNNLIRAWAVFNDRLGKDGAILDHTVRATKRGACKAYWGFNIDTDKVEIGYSVQRIIIKRRDK